MLRGVFLVSNFALDVPTTVWRRVMALLCARYPAWRLDSLDCAGEAEPEGTRTAAEVEEWLSSVKTIFFARALGYTDEAVEEKIRDYEDYRRAACCCALICVDAGYFEIYIKDGNLARTLHSDAALRALCETVAYITDENDGRTTFLI